LQRQKQLHPGGLTAQRLLLAEMMRALVSW
jgi:hypothetical protein